MKTRKQLIDSGKVWHVYKEGESEKVMYEGTRSNCLAWMKVNNLMRQYKHGGIRIAKLIFEP